MTLQRALARLIEVKTLEEFYYIITGPQYKSTPGLITEYQCYIGSTYTPVIRLDTS